MRLKARVWEIVEVAKPGDKLSVIFDTFMLCLILLNVLAIILGTVQVIAHRFGTFLTGFEICSVAIFTLEYLARLWSCTEDKRYSHPVKGRLKLMVRPLIIIDLLAILPFYLLFLDLDTRFLRLFRTLRLIRVAKIHRYYDTLHIMTAVFKAKKEELILTSVLMCFILIISSCFVYYFEKPVQPEAFPDIPATLWWAIVTLTTIGYGDVFPITIPGKFVTSLIAILGIGMFALPAGILGAGFVETIQKKRVAQRCPHCGQLLEETARAPESQTPYEHEKDIH